MFVRHHAIRKQLQPPYDDPYRVLKRAVKHYTLDISGRPEVASLDRHKPAYLKSDLVTDIDTPTQASSTVPSTEPPIYNNNPFWSTGAQACTF